MELISGNVSNRRDDIMNVIELTAKEILAVSIDAPEHLFSSPEFAKEEHRKLAKRWHSDINRDPVAASVIAHINAAWDIAEKKITAGLWVNPHTLTVNSVDNKTYKFNFRKIHDIGIGSMAVGLGNVLFIIRKEFDDIHLNGVRALGSIKYPSNDMKDQHEQYIPSIVLTVETKDSYVALVKKPDDFVLLSDLLTYLDGKLDPKHAAWMVSSLLNIACFYQISNLTHNGINADSVFISPNAHAAYPIGGWWYSVREGDKVKVLPPQSHRLASKSLLTTKIAESRLDLDCIKALGRLSLGDESGGSFRKRTDIPEPMANFLKLPSTGSAIEDYSLWYSKVIPSSFGARRFIKLDVSATDVYP